MRVGKEKQTMIFERTICWQDKFLNHVICILYAKWQFRIYPATCDLLGLCTVEDAKLMQYGAIN